MTEAQQSPGPPPLGAAKLDAAIAAISTRHGDRIDPEARAKAREVVTGIHAAVAALDAYPLTNADEPDPVFTAFQRD